VFFVDEIRRHVQNQTLSAMSDPALDYVHDTLRAYADLGGELRVSADALARLAATRTASDPASPAKKTPAPTANSAAPTSTPLPPRPSPSSSAPSALKSDPIPSNAPLFPPGTPRVAPLDGTKAERLAAMRPIVLACTKCPHLVRSRTQVVFGVGNPEAELMFVGEAPGEDEDRQGEPFVGKAGQLLTKIIETMGFPRSEVYIANVLKCRPDMPPGESGNRKPRADEMATCLPYLREQIDIIRPRALVALGATAMEGLTGQTLPMAKLRGRWHDFGGIPLMATYHPAYLLRNQALSEKRKVWEDMLMVLEKMNREPTDKQRGFFLPKS
jgi:DNA polymerase